MPKASEWPPRELTAPMDPAQHPQTGRPASFEQHQSRDQLAEAVSTAAGTVDVGASILNMLGAQRETLIQTRGSLQGTDRSLVEGNNLIRTMLRRSRTKKLILVAIVCGMLGIILLLIYAKLSNH
mmetsp:Transcript_11500/g.24821  ORF Transcript_11500/g.24821 Transcript_11500/m.24821 type:complete len:125 (+) Transcript_11500:200-574(+)